MRTFRNIFCCNKDASAANDSPSSPSSGDCAPLVEVSVLRPDLNHSKGFSSNIIHTAKYTYLSAIPLSFLSQFYKVSNVYFLLVVAISLIPSASPISPLTALIPFTVVLGVGILKDIWMDVKLQKADKQANMTLVSVLRNGEFVDVPSRKVYPGDVVLCRVGEEMRVDCVVLSTSLPEGVVYIETSNLDGESNAKLRRAKPETVDRLDTVEAIEENALFWNFGSSENGSQSSNRRQSGSYTANENEFPEERDHRNTAFAYRSSLPKDDTNCGLVIVGSAPNPDLSNWMGKLTFPSGEEISLDINQFLPCGSVIRNTEWALAVAMYAGKDTKISRNYHARKRKVAMFTKKLNHLNGFIFAFFQCAVLLLAGLGILFRNNTLRVHADKTTYSSWYMQYDLSLHENDLFLFRYLTNFVIFSNLIPVSLYVTLEFNKGVQLAMMAADLRMASKDEISGELRFTKPKTSDSTAELAHVRYIFTDKTGTLTENLMTYVGGFVEDHAHDEVTNPGGVGKQLCLSLSKLGQKKIDPIETSPPKEMLQVMRREIIAARRQRRQNADNEDCLSEGCELEKQEVETERKRSFSQGFMRTLSGSQTPHQWNGESVFSTGFPAPLSSTLLETFPPAKNAGPTGIFSPSIPGRSLLGSFQEQELESSAEFRYLRCLSLCHSVLSFEVQDGKTDINVASESGSENAEKEKEAEDTEETHALAHFQSESDADGKSFPLNSPVQHAKSMPISSVRNFFGLTSSSPPAKPPLADLQEVRRRSTFDGLPSTKKESRGRFLHRTNLGATSLSPLKSFGFKDEENREPGTEVVRMHLRMTSLLDLAESQELAGLDYGLSPRMVSRPVLHENTNSINLYRQGMHSRRETLTSLRGRQGVDHSSLLSTLIDRTKIYEGQSLDEVALVNAARENGFSLLSRSSRSITVKMLDTNRCYQIIAENAFTPERKLMSILLKLCPLEEAIAMDTTNGRPHYHREKLLDRSRKPSRLSFKGKGAEKKKFTNFFKKNLLGNKFPSHHLHPSKNSSPFGSSGISTPFPSVFETALHSPIQLIHTNDQERILSDSKKCAGKSLFSSKSSMCSSSSSEDRASASTTMMDATLNNVTVENESEHEHEAEGEGEVKKDRDESNPPMSVNTAASHAKKTHKKKRKGKENADHHNPKKNKDKDYSVSKRDSDAATIATTKGRQKTAAFDEEGESNRNSENGASPYLLLVKGADSSVLKILKNDSTENQKVLKPLTNNLNDAARGGLRTLVLGQRYVSEDEVREWLPKWESAANSMVDRHEKLSEVYKLIERDIELVGSTSVEDKLQDEVPETLQFFRDASIVVWMLTGDKRETAVRIAITSGLVDSGQEDCIVHLNVEEACGSMTSSFNVPEKQKKAVLSHNKDDSFLVKETTLQDRSSPTRSQGPLTEGNEDREAPLSESPMSLPGLSPLMLNDSDFSTPDASLGRREENVVAFTPEWFSSLQESGNEQEIRVGSQLLLTQQIISQKAQISNHPVVVLVVDGATLDVIFPHPVLKDTFLKIGTQCASAVCCRMTPSHKAKIVQLFKCNSSPVILAIGDGANDVSMIQESHVGVGVMGLEGSQVEMCSDYAIPKFRYLKRLLVVHGRLSLYRDSHCVLFCVYKSVFLVTGLGCFNFFNGFSGQILVNSWLLAFFNLFLTSVQPLIIGIFDKDIEDELVEAVPQIYPAISRENMFFAPLYVAKWMASGLVEGLFSFLVLILCIGYSDDFLAFHSAGLTEYGAAFYTIVIILVNIRFIAFIGHYNILSVGFMVILLAVLIIVLFVFCSFHYFLGPNEIVYVAWEIFGSPIFYLLLLAAIGVVFLFTFTSSLYIQLFTPWLNAPFAVKAAKDSPYSIEFAQNLINYQTEYERRVAYRKEFEKLGSSISFVDE